MTDTIREQCLQRMNEWEAVASKALEEGNATLAAQAKEHAAFFAARANPIALNYP